jgi:small-conductance mechanosensitive channel
MPACVEVAKVEKSRRYDKVPRSSATNQAVVGFHTQRKEIFMSFTKNIGFLLLAVWLILTGLSAFISMGGLAVILAILAIAAGIFILLGR